MLDEIRLNLVINIVITAITTGLIGYVVSLVKFQKNRQHQIAKATMATLRYAIVRAHKDYTMRGYIGDVEFEAVEKMYKEYKEMGGNGYAERLVNELRALPLNNN